MLRKSKSKKPPTSTPKGFCNLEPEKTQAVHSVKPIQKYTQQSVPLASLQGCHLPAMLVFGLKTRGAELAPEWWWNSCVVLHLFCYMLEACICYPT